MTNDDKALLQCVAVSSGYGSIMAIRGVSLDVHEREIVALVGTNGAGKSTMLKTIAGLVRASSGSIWFDNGEIQHLQPEEIVRRGIGLAPEGRGIFARLTVRDNLRLGAATRRDNDGVAADMEEMYAQFPVLKERQSQLAGTLSGGEQQMLAIARSLMSRPKMLLLDEPSLGLAPRLVRQIFDMVALLPARGVAVLLVEQNVSLALKAAARAYVLTTGEIQASGTSEELARSVDLEQLYLGRAVDARVAP